MTDIKNSAVTDPAPVPATYKLPKTVWRLWSPQDQGFITPQNPVGFAPPLVEKGWDKAWAEGFGWGEKPLDELLPYYPNFAVFWAHGSRKNSDPPRVIGKYPAAMGGGSVTCSPRDPTELALAESVVPGFWKSLAKRVEMSHKYGGRVMVYYGTPPLSLFPQNLSTSRRNAMLDSLIQPAKDAGIDFIGCDACAPTTQTPTKTDGMYFAERVLHHGIGFVVEAMEQIHPELFPWFNGRFSGLSMRSSNLQHSRWDLNADGKGWFGPGHSYCLKEVFCGVQGSEPVSVRPSLIVQEKNGQKVNMIMEMGDVPHSWFDME